MSARALALAAAAGGLLVLSLASINPFFIDSVVVPGQPFRIPVWALIVGAFLSGVFLTLVAVLLRDIREAFHSGRKRGGEPSEPSPLGPRQPSGDATAASHYAAGKEQLESGSAREAIRHFREALRRDRGFGPAYLLLGDAYEHVGERKEAIRTWERGAERTWLLPLLQRLEDASRQESRPSQMIALYQRALARLPGSQAVAFHLGRVYFELSMLDDAREHFQRIEAALPDVPALHAYLGAILERRGQAREACVEYAHALQLGRLFEWPHVCSACGLTNRMWSDRCEACGKWDSSQPLTYPAERPRSVAEAALERPAHGRAAALPVEAGEQKTSH